MITDYNKYMGGVDCMDQMLLYYSIGRPPNGTKKSRRIIDLTRVNVYMLYSICHPDRMMKQKAFRLQLANNLVENTLMQTLIQTEMWLFQDTEYPLYSHD